MHKFLYVQLLSKSSCLSVRFLHLQQLSRSSNRCSGRISWNTFSEFINFSLELLIDFLFLLTWQAMFKLLHLFDVVVCERLCIPFDANKKVDYFRIHL